MTIGDIERVSNIERVCQTRMVCHIERVFHTNMACHIDRVYIEMVCHINRLGQLFTWEVGTTLAVLRLSH